MLQGRGALELEQWTPVWDRSAEFDFDYAHATSFEAGGGFCVAAPWRSLGLREPGPAFERCGRATLLLIAGADGLIAAHSHFSLNP